MADKNETPGTDQTPADVTAAATEPTIDAALDEAPRVSTKAPGSGYDPETGAFL